MAFWAFCKQQKKMAAESGWPEGSALLSAADKVSKKQRSDPVGKRIDETTGMLNDWLEDDERHGDSEMAEEKPLGEEDHERAKSLATLVDRLEANDPKAMVHEYHKELAALVNKLAKAIDKAIPARVEQSLPDLDLDPKLIDQAIYTHLLSVGLFDVAETLRDEAALEVGGAPGGDLAPPLRELHAACGAMRAHQTGPALEWVGRHQEELSDRGASLRFLLHRLQARARRETKGKRGGKAMRECCAAVPGGEA